MTTVDDLIPGRSLPGPITVRVADIDWCPANSRRAEVELIDEKGNPIQLVDFEGADISADWKKDHHYRISRCGVSKGSRGYDLALTPSKKTRIKHIGEITQTTQVFILGDTHVGYRHRPQGSKANWARGVNGQEVFSRCMQRAREAEVEAIVHTGDVFDHHNTRRDRNRVREEISRTVSSGIPFYYIYGNHDNKQARQLLDSTSGIHLSEDSIKVGDPPVNLIGIDHSGQDFPSESSNFSVDSFRHLNIVIIHDTPHPVVNNRGILQYQNDSNKVDLTSYIESVGFEIDIIITGHLHVANRLHIKRDDIPVLVTGPTIPISKYEADSQPSTWLLRADQEDFEVNRHKL